MSNELDDDVMDVTAQYALYRLIIANNEKSLLYRCVLDTQWNFDQKKTPSRKFFLSINKIFCKTANWKLKNQTSKQTKTKTKNIFCKSYSGKKSQYCMCFAIFAYQ